MVILVPTTINSGAKISIVPKKLIKSDDFVGETLKFKGVLAGYEWTEVHVAKVSMSIEKESFVEKVLAVPGKDLEWTAVLKFDCGDEAQWSRVSRIIAWKKSLPEDQKRFLPPTS